MGALVATAIIAALNMIGPESWQATAGEIQKSAVSGMVFVFAGAFIAPTARMVTAIALTVIFGVFTGFVAGRLVFTPWITINLISGMSAAILACVAIKIKTKDPARIYNA